MGAILVGTKGGSALLVPIYGDILLVINFSMDFFVLWLTSKLLHRPARTLPMFAAATFGAFYALATLFFHMGEAMVLVANLAASVVICFVGFWRVRTMREFLRATALFYATNFLLGGTMTALYSLCNSYLFADRIYAFGELFDLGAELSFGGFLVLAAVSGAAAMLFGRYWGRTRTKHTLTAEVTLAARTATLSLFADSGNLLCDPIDGTPVVVCALPAVERVLSPRLAAFFSYPDPARVALLGAEARRVRVIPIQGANDGGLCFAFRPDCIRINGTTVTALVAPDPARAAGSFAETDGLLPAALTE